MEQRKRRRSGWRIVVSWLLFASCAAVLALMAFIYIRDREEKDPTPPVPTSEPGRNFAQSVITVLRDEDLDAQYAQGTVRSAALSVPGQAMTVDDVPLYVFIYADVASREDDSDGLDPTAISLTTPSGAAITGGAPHVATGSNVIAILLGGSDEVIEKVDRAIEGLP